MSAPGPRHMLFTSKYCSIIIVLCLSGDPHCCTKSGFVVPLLVLVCELCSVEIRPPVVQSAERDVIPVTAEVERETNSINRRWSWSREELRLRGGDR